MSRAASPGTRRGSRTLIAATIAMALLLIGLAVLQFRWVGQVSQAERERLKRALRTSADRIADDVDREVFRAFIAFQPHRQSGEALADRLADGWERWRASALEPGMVEAVYVAGPEADSGDDATSIARLDPDARVLRPAAWPRELAALEAMVERTGARRSTAGPMRRPWEPLLSSAPALVLPLWGTPRDRRPEVPAAARDRSEPSIPAREPSSVIVLLDRRVLADTVLPTLVDLHLGASPRETQVWVIDRSRRDDLVYATTPGSRPPPRQAEDDTTVRPILDLRFFPELRAQGFQRFFDDPETRRQIAGAPWDRSSGERTRERPDGWRPPHGDDSRARAADDGPPPADGRPPAPDFRARLGSGDQRAWALVLAPAEGALDAAVAKLRRRNLGVGLGAVFLLGATSALLLFSARRAQSLARREMELVAGITHELRTPLASIASAADNLADGVVREPAQIRRYGGLIKGETHRLGALVSQVLDFAGSAATARRMRPVEPVDVATVVDSVLDDHRFTIEETGVEVERSAPSHAVRVLADPDALRRALDNVVGNALKYGAAGRWLGVEIADAGSDARTHEVVVRVRDRGPGIARGDRRRVFEPFYRGPGAQHLHGAGLGLAVTRSVVESLGGSIEIEDGAGGRGATFAIRLRAAPPDTAPDPVPAESPT